MTIILMILFSDSFRCLDDGNTEQPDATATESQNARDFVVVVAGDKHILPSWLVVLQRDDKFALWAHISSDSVWGP